jgi:hypothetical protein
VQENFQNVSLLQLKFPDAKPQITFRKIGGHPRLITGELAHFQHLEISRAFWFPNNKYFSLSVSLQIYYTKAAIRFLGSFPPTYFFKISLFCRVNRDKMQVSLTLKMPVTVVLKHFGPNPIMALCCPLTAQSSCFTALFLRGNVMHVTSSDQSSKARELFNIQHSGKVFRIGHKGRTAHPFIFISFLFSSF